MYAYLQNMCYIVKKITAQTLIIKTYNRCEWTCSRSAKTSMQSVFAFKNTYINMAKRSLAFLKKLILVKNNNHFTLFSNRWHYSNTGLSIVGTI